MSRRLLGIGSDTGAQRDRPNISAGSDEVGANILNGLLTEFPAAQQWLPDVDGIYEEERLPTMLADLMTGPVKWSR